MILKLALSAIIIHIILLFQIYDTYYKYLPVTVKRPLCSWSGGKAKRLVMFVVDDLNTNDAEELETLPYVKGVSHVRGVLEGPLVEDDVQALTALTAGYVPTSKWMSYPWKIKHSFLEEAHAFYFGYQKVRGLFRLPRMKHFPNRKANCYPKAFCPFNLTAQDPRLLWDPKTVFVFHVEAPDVIIYRDKRRAFWVDQFDNFIEQVAGEITNFYKDDSTNFFITSGFLKSAWGPYKSRGLFFAWGPSFRKIYQQEHLDRLKVPTLLAASLGVKVPSNSLGVLPHHLLNTSDEEMDLIVTCAAVQKSALALTISENFFTDILWLFEGTSRPWIKSRISRFYDKYATNDFLGNGLPMRIVSSRIESDSTEMIDEYRTRMAQFLLIFATLTLSGWFLYLCLVAFSPDEEQMTTIIRNFFKGGRSAIGKIWIFINIIIMISFIGTSIVTAILTAETYIPLRYELYVFLAIFCVFLAYFKLQTTRILSKSWKCIMKIGLFALISIFLIETVYWMFSFHLDPLLHIILATIFFSYPVASRSMKKIPPVVLFLWILSWATLLVVLFLRFFETPTTVISFNLGCLLTIILSFIVGRRFLEGTDYGLGVGGTAAVTMATIMANAADILSYTTSTNRIPIVLMSWLTMLLPILVPWLGSKRVLPRLILNWIYWSVPLILLSSSSEILGILAVMVTLGCWMAIDLAQHDIPYNPASLAEVAPFSRSHLSRNDVMRSLIVFSYVHTSVSLGVGESSATYDSSKWLRTFLFSSVDLGTTILIIYKTFISIFFPTSVLIAHSLICGANLRKIYAFLLLLFGLLNFRAIVFMSWKAMEMCQMKFSVLVLILLSFAFLIGKTYKLEDVKAPDAAPTTDKEAERKEAIEMVFKSEDSSSCS